MQRYFLDDELSNEITGTNHFHVTKVMRNSIGDVIIVCKNSLCHEVRITGLDTKVTYEKVREVTRRKSFKITLLQGNLKSSKLETTYKYAAMFGIDEIIVTNMNRSIAKVSNSPTKIIRYETIIKEASELSHQNTLPKLFFLPQLNIDFSQYDLIFLADEGEKDKSLSDFNEEIIESSNILVIIGPEGGLTSNERELYSLQLAKKISLGATILAAEIAIIHPLAYINELKSKN